MNTYDWLWIVGLAAGTFAIAVAGSIGHSTSPVIPLVALIAYISGAAMAGGAERSRQERENA